MPDIILIPSNKIKFQDKHPSKLPLSLEKNLLFNDVITPGLYYKPLQQRILGIYAAISQLSVVY